MASGLVVEARPNLESLNPHLWLDEGLDRRASADVETIITARYRQTVERIVEAMQIDDQVPRSKAKAGEVKKLAITIVVVTGAFIFLKFHNPQGDFWDVFGLAPVLFLYPAWLAFSLSGVPACLWRAYMGRINRALAEAQFKVIPEAERDLEWRFSDGSLERRSSGVSIRRDWSAVAEVTEVPAGFQIHWGKFEKEWIPGEAFDSLVDARRFADLAVSRVSKYTLVEECRAAGSPEAPGDPPHLPGRREIPSFKFFDEPDKSIVVGYRLTVAMGEKEERTRSRFIKPGRDVKLVFLGCEFLAVVSFALVYWLIPLRWDDLVSYVLLSAMACLVAIVSLFGLLLFSTQARVMLARIGFAWVDEAEKDVEWQFSGDFLEKRTAKVVRTLRWDSVTEVIELPEGFLIRVGEFASEWVPSEAFGSLDDVDRLAGLAEGLAKKYLLVGECQAADFPPP